MTEIDPSICSDREWFNETGHCGGCGDPGEGCHPGWPCGDVLVSDPMREGGARVCDRCQYRVDTGQIRHLRANTSGSESAA